MIRSVSLRSCLLLTIVLVSAGAASVPDLPFWGRHGHAISGRAAATNLPAEMPAFFRGATAQLEYLNPEPDEWRKREATLRQMDNAFEFDHYVHMELLTAEDLQAEDRFVFLENATKKGIPAPADSLGLLYYRILEVTQRLETGFRRWRAAPAGSPERGWIEQRIINDAGILGHYVTDGANPHHTSVHYNGWNPAYPNPRGFSTETGFHGRFETQFVQARVTVNDLLPQVDATPRELADYRRDVEQYLRASNARLTRLYELDQQAAFNATTNSPAHKQFAVERLVAGAEMLRDLWWTAWRRSASPPA
jgi:hypothetical protein